MKKFFTLIVLPCIMAGCASNDSYEIKGEVKDADLEGAKIYKAEYVCPVNESDNTLITDSTTIQNGKYTFSGTITDPAYCTLYTKPGSSKNGKSIFAVITLEKGKINVISNKEGNIIASGTPMNDSFYSYRKKHGELFAKYRETGRKYYMAATDSTAASKKTDSLLQSLNSCYKDMSELSYNYVKENVNNPAVWYYELQNAAFSGTDVNRMKGIIVNANGYTKKLPLYKEISKRIDVLERTAIGKQFTDFTMQDINGNEVKLSDYVGKGKYVLLDFWASWCAPCRAEMPNVLEAHEKFAGKDFEIVGVSLDSRKDAWANAINELNLPWPNISDLKGYECEGAIIYGISGIPATVLFDRNGTIIARDLRGDELAYELGKLLKQ